MPDCAVSHILMPADLPADAYALRMAETLHRCGYEPVAHRLAPPRRAVDGSATLAADLLLERIPDGSALLFDGGLLPTLAGLLPLDSRRLRFVALMERPGWEEAGPAAAARRHLEQAALALTRCVAVPDGDAARALAPLGLPADRLVVAPPDEAGAAMLLARLQGPGTAGSAPADKA
ncbi:glycosyl transferase [Azospirillum thermophilum]|uniref:Glycosyl transferase n=1 Tax=Azospirillum thermophilum TaxID=2202148 RepID=A0A2S2CNQ5_9PROT|nr:glycosyl transferase [Azospirillum thermophilum]AWK86065.1 glycosyl transferase [Azospirillum thermophilum]